MPWKIEGEGDQARIALKDGKAVAVVKGKDGADEEVYIDADAIMGKVRDLTAEAATHRTKAQDLEAKFAPFANLQIDGKPVEPDAVTQAFATLKNLKDGQLLNAEKAQALKDEAVREANRTIEALTAEKTKLQQDREQDQIGFKFATSRFVTERLAYKVDHARQVFGPFFKMENGRPVAYVNGERVMSKKTYGEIADVDEALSIIVEADPDKDRYLRPDEAGGSGAQPSAGSRTSNQHIISRDDARDARKYEAAKERAAKDGVELQIAAA